MEQLSPNLNATQTAPAGIESDAVFITDPNGRYVEVNDAGCALMNCQRSEILGKTVRDFCGVGDAQEQRQLESRLRMPGRLRFDSILRRPDGTLVPVDVYTQLLPSGERCSIVRDISDRRQREREEQREREILTRLHGLSTLHLSGQNDEVICTAILDVAISLSGADCGCLQIYEAGSADLYLAAVRNLPPAWRERSARLPAALGVAGVALAERTQIVVADAASYGQGTMAATADLALLAGVRSLLATPLFSRSGEPLAVLTTGYQAQPLAPPSELKPLERLQQHAADILAQLRTLGRLRRSEVLYTGILAVAGDAILCVDAGQHVSQWNDAAEKMFGYSRREAIGLSLELLLPKASRIAQRGNIDRFLHATGPSRAKCHFSGSALRRGGEAFPIDARIAHLEIDGTSWMVLAVRDISEQRQAEAEGRLLTALAGVLSAPDYEATLQAIVQIVTEHIAEFAVLFVSEDGGNTLRRAASTARDPKLGWAAAQMMHLPDKLPQDHAVWTVLRERRPIVAGLDSERYAAMAQSPEHLRALRAAAPKCAVVMPLVVAGSSVGVLGLSRASSHFDERELRVIEAIAERCAVYIENALRHRRNAAPVPALDRSADPTP